MEKQNEPRQLPRDPKRYASVEIDLLHLTPAMVNYLNDFMSLTQPLESLSNVWRVFHCRLMDGDMPKDDIDDMGVVMDLLIKLEQERWRRMRYPADPEDFNL